LKRLVPGGHVALRFADHRALTEAAAVLGVGPDPNSGESLVLRVPGDGGVRSLKALLDRLEIARVEVEGLSVHTPDLDDVFFAVTGQPADAAVSASGAGAVTAR
jgi:ABC-2 type transport system ATP-binding protein